MIEDNKILGFPLERETLERVGTIGNHALSFEHGGKTYYLDMVDARPCLNTESGRIKLRHVASWPTSALSADTCEDYSLEQGRTVRFCKRANDNSVPVLHPQFVFLGENWSNANNGTANLVKNALESQIWYNGFGEQAQILGTTPLSGGYFTDIFKCFAQSHLSSKDKKRLLSPALCEDRQIDDLTWLNVFLEVFRGELEQLKTIFTLPDACPKYIFVWGIGFMNLLDDLIRRRYGEKKTFAKMFSELGYEVRVAGLHYSCLRKYPQHAFPDDNRNTFKSCARFYRTALDLSADKRDDRRRYDFALIDGKICAGNSVQD